jgi:hypothetical protein
MPAQYGPQKLPYPQPSEAPDGPGVILALAQGVGVGGVYPYATLSALPAAGVFTGQYAVVTSDATVANNGLYMWSGTAWVQQTGDTGWITPALSLSWTSVAGFTVQYRKFNGLVMFRGRATGGTTGVAFTLPAGFRTTGQDKYYTVLDSGSTSTTDRVYIQAAGGVNFVTGTIPNLDGIAPFPADA